MRPETGANDAGAPPRRVLEYLLGRWESLARRFDGAPPGLLKTLQADAGRLVAETLRRGVQFNADMSGLGEFIEAARAADDTIGGPGRFLWSSIWTTMRFGFERSRMVAQVEPFERLRPATDGVRGGRLRDEPEVLRAIDADLCRRIVLDLRERMDAAETERPAEPPATAAPAEFPAAGGIAAPAEPPAAGAPAAVSRLPRPKKSTTAGDARAKLIAALLKHHGYENGCCINYDPIGNNALARLADVAGSSASKFMKSEAGGYAKYRTTCRNTTALNAALAALAGERPARAIFNPTRIAAPDPDNAD